MLRGRDVIATVVGAMVGAGIFRVPGDMLVAGATPWMVLGLFVLGGALAILGALTLAELTAAHPGNGGPYRYIREEIGARPASLFNWSRFWVIQTGTLAVLALLTAQFGAAALGIGDPYWEAVVAIGLIGASAAVNARGLPTGAAVQRGLTGLKIAALLAIVFGVLFATRPDGFQAAAPAAAPAGFGTLLLFAVFAYGGWTQVTLMAGEFEDSARFVRPLVVGVLVVMAIYLGAITAMMLAMPAGFSDGLIVAEAAEGLWGTTGGRVVAATVAIAVLGSLHTLSLTGPRLYQEAARAGHWWGPFADENPAAAPGKAIWFQALWASLLIAFAQWADNAFWTLVGATSVAIWGFHALTAAAWFRLRARMAASDFRTPFGQWIAGTFLVASVLVVALATWDDVQHLRSGSWGSLKVTWAALIVGSGGLLFLVHRTTAPEDAASA